jgi:hypothetical protein
LKCLSVEPLGEVILSGQPKGHSGIEVGLVILRPNLNGLFELDTGLQISIRVQEEETVVHVNVGVLGSDLVGLREPVFGLAMTSFLE